MPLIANIFGKKQKIIGAVLLIMLLLLSGCAMKESNTPKAFQGKLDLRNWDFERDGAVPLDGQWELYWGELLEPGDFKNSKKEAPDFFEIPNSFTTTVKGKKLPKDGYGTMRLLIYTKANSDRLYGIKTQFILSASKVWINGQLATSAGVVGTDKHTAVGSFERQLASFRNEGDQVEIIIQMSNFNNIKGKIQSILLGNGAQIKRDYIFRAGGDLFIVGCLFIIGMHHFVLYYKKPLYREPLYFGIFCSVLAFRSLLVSQKTIFEFYPNISFSLFNKLAYLTVYFGVPLLVMFLKEIFNEEISKRVVRAVQISSILLSIIVLFTELESYNKFLVYYEILMLLTFGYILSILVKAALQRKPSARIILFGLVLFTITILHDMLLQAAILHTTSLAPFGLLCFVFSQSYMLASRSSNAFNKIERLLEENKALYTDELTGILNRRGFLDQGNSLYKVMSSTGGKFMLFYGDLNKLKSINDSFGHQEGDEAIKATAQILKESFNQEDIVARISGDEFTAITVNKGSAEEANQIIENIHHNFLKYNLTSQKPYELSISIGYSLYLPSEKTTFEELIGQADAMLYLQKEKKIPSSFTVVQSEPNS